VLVAFLFTDIASDFYGFLDTQQGAQLMTLTGRDQIWAVAIEEWQAHKVFGFGPSLFDYDYRMGVGIPNATNGHNQFMDTLARSGTVGAIALVGYAIVLLVLSVRYARRTGGLSLALFITLALRSVSEVPLLLFGYGTELFAHLLLIVTLAAGASMRVPVAAARRQPAYGVPA
jgi:O-antigen ligase